jgi:hypothetical protein
MAGNHGGGISRRDSHSPAPNSNNHPAMQRHQQGHGQQQTTYQQWNGGYDSSNLNGNGGANGADSQSTPNPLIGISTESIDVVDPSVSIMPPPSFTFTPSYEGNSNNNNGSMDNGQNQNYTPNFGLDDGGYMPDWLALPLDNLLNSSYDGGVTQTEVGPDVGGYDLLEILLSEMESNGAV